MELIPASYRKICLARRTFPEATPHVGEFSASSIFEEWRRQSTYESLKMKNSMNVSENEQFDNSLLLNNKRLDHGHSADDYRILDRVMTFMHRHQNWMKIYKRLAIIGVGITLASPFLDSVPIEHQLVIPLIISVELHFQK
jgi:hypothetical protein